MFSEISVELENLKKEKEELLAKVAKFEQHKTYFQMYRGKPEFSQKRAEYNKTYSEQHKKEMYEYQKKGKYCEHCDKNFCFVSNYYKHKKTKKHLKMVEKSQVPEV
jgi:hypothetical protein